MRATSRTQPFIVPGDSQHNWLVVSASPDILAQLCSSPMLQPVRVLYDTGIVSVMLMDA